MTGPDPDDGDNPLADDPRVQAGLEHLQRAAREVIAASRALLDVAEELVEDPKAAAGIVEVLGNVTGKVRATAVNVAAAGAAAGARAGHADDPDADPPVQRIPVS